MDDLSMSLLVAGLTCCVSPVLRPRC